MKEIFCENCGSNDLFEENGYRICKYCGSKYFITLDDKTIRQSSIDLNSDVERLLRKCQEEPERAIKCAQRILEIDPNNEEALRILGNNRNQSGGCYIATAVYGSYDCPNVWTLRRYRDYSLAETWYGRGFICMYYAVSPTLVKWFGKSDWFVRICKPFLDRLVYRLNREGIANTRYEDRIW